MRHRESHTRSPASSTRSPRCAWIARAEVGALRAAWARSDAAVLAYMDVDLSTDLAALEELLAPLLAGRAELAIGSRLAPGAAGRRAAEARADLALLQPAAAPAPPRRVLRRPMRLQGRPARSDPSAPAHRRGRQLVLRHRAAPPRPAQRAHHPRGPGALGRRPDSRVDILATAREDLRGIRRLRAQGRERARNGSRRSRRDAAPPAAHLSTDSQDSRAAVPVSRASIAA